MYKITYTRKFLPKTRYKHTNPWKETFERRLTRAVPGNKIPGHRIKNLQRKIPKDHIINGIQRHKLFQTPPGIKVLTTRWPQETSISKYYKHGFFQAVPNKPKSFLEATRMTTPFHRLDLEKKIRPHLQMIEVYYKPLPGLGQRSRPSSVNPLPHLEPA